MLQLDKKVRLVAQWVGITANSPLFKTMLHVRNRFVTPLRERFGRVKVWWKSSREKALEPHSRKEMDALLIGFGQAPLESVEALISRAESDSVGAERLILSLLIDRSDLQIRFPLALSQGSDGDFAQWLSGEGASELGLAENAIKHLQAAFLRHPGALLGSLGRVDDPKRDARAWHFHRGCDLVFAGSRRRSRPWNT